MHDSKLYIPDFVMISHALQICENISDAARIYCGQLRAISNRFKYCWATDDELSKLKGKDKRTIQRWHQELEEAGFISRKCVNKPIKEDGKSWRWIRTRKMYIYDTPYDNPDWVKKHLLNATPGDVPPSPLDMPDDTQIDADAIFADPADSDVIYGDDRTYGICDDVDNCASNIVNSQSKPLKITEAAAAVVVNFNLDKLDLTPMLKLRILAGYTIEEIDLAVKRCLGWKGRPSDDIGIMTALNKAETWIDNASASEKKELCENFLESLMQYDQKTIALTRVVVGKTYIEFSSGMRVNTYDINQNDFKAKVTEHLNYLIKQDQNFRKQGVI